MNENSNLTAEQWFALGERVPYDCRAKRILRPGAPGSENKPNIVLVLMDNFGYGEVGVYGGGVLRGAPTPNIDSIAAEGFQLANFNVEAECTPSGAKTINRESSRRNLQRIRSVVCEK